MAAGLLNCGASGESHASSPPRSCHGCDRGPETRRGCDDEFDEEPGAITPTSWFWRTSTPRPTTPNECDSINSFSRRRTKAATGRRRGGGELTRWTPAGGAAPGSTLIYSSSRFKAPSVLNGQRYGTEARPRRHGPNSRESWQLLGIDGTLMDINPPQWMNR